jgi:hypothetical protein
MPHACASSLRHIGTSAISYMPSVHMRPIIETYFAFATPTVNTMAG